MSYQYENLLSEAKKILTDSRIIIDSIINKRIQSSDSSLVNHIEKIDSILNNINYYDEERHTKKRIKLQNANNNEGNSSLNNNNQNSNGEVQQTISKINTLPDEVLIKIFKYINYYNELSDCVLVCKKWKSLGTPILYETPAIYSLDSWTKLKCAIDFSSKPIKQYLGSLIKNLNFIRLETNNTRSVESLVIYLAKLCPNVETINLSSITLDGAVIRRIIDKFPKLEFIDISINLLTEKIINKILAPHIHKIKSLHIENDLLSNQDLISDEEFKAFTVKAKQLEEIQFDFFMSHLTVEGFNDAIDQIPNLTGVGIVTEDSLNFDDELMFSVKFINDYIVNHGEKLTKLFFGGSTILENTLNLVAENCPNLETFGIELPSRFATLDQNEEEVNHDIPLCYNAFLKIASKCVKIKYLEIDRLRSEEVNTSYCDKVMKEFLINCKDLSVLLIRESTLSPTVLETLNEYCKEKLEILEIYTVDHFVNFENFPDVMQQVINNCKKLRILSLPAEDNTEYNLPEDLCLYEETSELLSVWNIKKQLPYYRYYANMNSQIEIDELNEANEDIENTQAIVHRNVVPRIAVIRS